jgi:RNA polymerase sigma-70 factor (sigma-E family)
MARREDQCEQVTRPLFHTGTTFMARLRSADPDIGPVTYDRLRASLRREMITTETRTTNETRVGSSRAGRLEDLYTRHAPAGMRLAYFLTGDRELAGDLVQDAFVKVVGRFGHLRVPDAFDAYLRRTIVNLFSSHLRRLRLERRALVRQRSAGRPEQPDRDVAERDAMWSELQTLPPRQRAALVLRYYEDLSERETAEVLGCSVGAAKQLVTRGLTALRGRIGSEER